MQRKVTLRDLREGTVTEAELEEIRASLTAPGKALSADGIGPMVIQALLNFQEAGRDWDQEAKSLYAILDMTIDEADAYIREHPPSAGVIALLLDMSLSTYKSDLARRNGEKKYAKTQRDKAMAYVLEEWQKNDGSYSKASFSTYMVGRVLKFFAYEITARQMERVWLKGR